MKPKVNRRDLFNTDYIWNAAVSAMSTYDFPTENEAANEAFIVFQYYSELESGGHESLFTWFSEYINEIGINNYLKKLIAILEKIGAHDYATIEKMYGEELWQLFIALENNEIEEDAFYQIVEKADNEYYKLNGQLSELIETYFVNIHTDLLEVVDS